jgi:molybdopterin synthase catalytic subunit
MIRVQAELFDPAMELAGFARGRTDVGGVASFTGFVRDEHGGEPVVAMTLEHYPGMTERQLAAIEAEARERWPLLDVLVIHRY